MFLFYPANVVRETSCWVDTELPMTISIGSTPTVMSSLICVQANGRILKNITPFIPNISFLLIEDLDYINKNAIKMERIVLHKHALQSRKNRKKNSSLFNFISYEDELNRSFAYTRPQGQ